MVSSNCTDHAVGCNSLVTKQVVLGLQLHLILLEDYEQCSGEACQGLMACQGHDKVIVCCSLHDGAESAPSLMKQAGPSALWRFEHNLQASAM